MDFGALVAFGLPLVKKLVDLVSYVLSREFARAAKVLTAYVIATGLTFVVAHSDYASLLGLDHLNAWSLVLGGIVVGSTAAFGADVLAAADNTQTAANPPLSLHLFGKPKPGGSAKNASRSRKTKPV